jgi:hypothetical protein
MRVFSTLSDLVTRFHVLMCGSVEDNHPKRYSLILSSTQALSDLVRNQSPLHHHTQPPPHLRWRFFFVQTHVSPCSVEES